MTATMPPATTSDPTTAGTTATVPARSISVRRPGLTYDEATVPRWFVAGDPLRSHIAANLSGVFPEGEDFFVRSVRAYRDEITDPELKKQVQGFIGQEALHGREHREFNERLQSLGYPMRFIDKRVKIGLGILGRFAPKPVQLAVTSALEHYTATLAETLLTEPGARDEFATEEIRSLFTWHALEETEHKSVAFDVLRHVSDNEKMRIRVMRITHVGFLLPISVGVLVSLVLDRDARRRPLTVLRSLWRLRTHPFFTRKVVDRLRDYHRPGFHPDDHDTTELLATWSRWYEQQRGKALAS